MTQKSIMGSPLYRQEQELNRQEIRLSRQTMSNWILRASQDYLTPVYKLLHRELLKREVLHADETTLQVLHEPGKAPQRQIYLWLYRTSGDAARLVVICEYQPGRGAKHPKAFLNGFRGYLHTDGYAGYHNLLEEIPVVGCWAHARRKFDEAMKSLPKSKTEGSSAAQGPAYCDKLFEIDMYESQQINHNQEVAHSLSGLPFPFIAPRFLLSRAFLHRAALFSFMREIRYFPLDFIKPGL